MPGETSPSQPQTASCAIPLIALAITVVCLLVAIPITRNVIGRPMREMEKEAVPVAQAYLEKPGDVGQDFVKRMGDIIGVYQSSRVAKFGTEKGDPPKVYVTLYVKGSKGDGTATIEMQKNGGDYVVTDAGVMPR